MSGNQDWRTPPELLTPLRREFAFTFDLAATADDAICERFATGPCNRCDESAPIQARAFCRCGHCVDLSGETVFCNPPYAKVDPWVEQLVRLGQANTVAALLQPKTDVEWFRRIAETAREVRFLKGRVQFIHPGTGERGQNSNNAGSILAVWRPGHRPPAAHMWVWDWRSPNG